MAIADAMQGPIRVWSCEVLTCERLTLPAGETGKLTGLQARYTDRHSLVQAAKRKLARLQAERKSYLTTAGSLEKVAVDHLWSLASGKERSDGKTPPRPYRPTGGV